MIHRCAMHKTNHSIVLQREKCARRVTAKGPRLFDAFAYNMYNVDGQRAMAVAVNTLAGLRRDTGAAVPVSVGEYSAFSAR